jgi:subtilisin family serine protease
MEGDEEGRLEQSSGPGTLFAMRPATSRAPSDPPPALDPMSILRVSLLGAALSLLPAATAPVARAEPARELVVALAPARPGSTAREAQAVLGTRIEALGLRFRESLASRLPSAVAPLPGRGAALGLPAPGVETGPFALDPERIWLLEAPDSATAATALEALLADPGVEWAEPNRVRSLAALPLDPPVPNDPLLRDGRQWGLRNLGPAAPWGGVAGADIRALEAWVLCSGSNDVLLAVADTGIDPAHPDLAATMPDGSPRIIHAVNLTGLEPADAIADSNYHGTGVAGVVAARTNDGPHFDSLGVAGVCGGDGRGNFGCHLVPIKISPRHSGSATSYAISAAALYATAVGARAMNLSYAGDGPSRLERLAMHWAIARGCVVVAAAGNSGYPGGPGPMYPAAYAADGLGIQVGATDRFDHRTYWSSYGPDMDLMAPGLEIWTTYMTYPNAAGTVYPGYVAESGTSFAAPFVTGAVGLLAAARPELADVDFKHVLRESAHDIGAPGVDALTGWGRLDAAAALEAVGPDIGIWHDEVAGQSFRALGSDTLQVDEGGFGTLGHWSGRNPAELVEVTATVALPDSFLGPVRVWPRVGGTTTVRGGWRLPYFVPWAEVAEWTPPGTTLPGAARSFTLRGYIYQIADPDCPGCPDDGYTPLPPTQTRFGFTVLGRVDRPPTVTLLAPAPGRTLAPGDTLTARWTATDPDQVTSVGVDLVQTGRPPLALARVAAGAGTAGVTIPCGAWPGGGVLRVTAYDEHGAQRDQAWADAALQVRAAACNGGADAALRFAPNPFRGALRISGPAGTRITIFDLSGRRRRTVLLDGGGAFAWDGRDDSGRAVAPGLYFARAGNDTRLAKLVRIE